VLGHSLGSLVCYDAFTDPGTRGLARDVVFASLGSQIANPFVLGQFAAGRLVVPQAVRHWYHLFNPNDVVFTAPIDLVDARFTQVDTPFGGWPHAESGYLAHPTTARSLWWALVHREGAERLERGFAERPPAPARALVPPTRRALLVGINESPDAKNRLAGCVNDTFLMSSVLQEAGIEAENIRLVLDDRATAAGIKERVDWLLDGVRDGDRRVLFYSGHGAQLPTYGFGGRTDAVKECLVPWDFDWSEKTALTDDWFHALYAHLPYGCDFLAVFDCCHSGGMTRAGARRVRGLDPPDDIRHRALRWSVEHEM